MVHELLRAKKAASKTIAIPTAVVNRLSRARPVALSQNLPPDETPTADAKRRATAVQRHRPIVDVERRAMANVAF